ncbi:hypothetical protein JCM10212_005087 [Sporobolomyces blumeae]
MLPPIHISPAKSGSSHRSSAATSATSSPHDPKFEWGVSTSKPLPSKPVAMVADHRTAEAPAAANSTPSIPRPAPQPPSSSNASTPNAPRSVPHSGSSSAQGTPGGGFGLTTPMDPASGGSEPSTSASTLSVASPPRNKARPESTEGQIPSSSSRARPRPAPSSDSRLPPRSGPATADGFVARFTKLPPFVDKVVLEHYLLYGPRAFADVSAADAEHLSALIDCESISPPVLDDLLESIPPIPRNVKVYKAKKVAGRGLMGGEATYGTKADFDLVVKLFGGKKLVEAYPGGGSGVTKRK